MTLSYVEMKESIFAAKSEVSHVLYTRRALGFVCAFSLVVFQINAGLLITPPVPAEKDPRDWSRYTIIRYCAHFTT